MNVMNGRVPHTVTTVTPDDRQLLDVVRLGEAMWSESPVYGHMDKDVDTMIRFAYTMRADDNSFFNVAVRNGEAVGFLIGSLAPHGYHSDVFAYDRLVYAAPTMRGMHVAKALITAFEQWAADKGAARVLLGVTTGVHTDSTVSFYNKLGYTTVGALTMKEL